MLKTLRDEFPSVIDISYKEYLKHKHISDIMTKDLVQIESDATMLDAAKLMGEKHIGSLLVKGPERPSGIVTERDLLTRVIAAEKDPKNVKVFEVMSPRLITIKLQATIKEGARTMIKEKGRLVVVEGRRVVGIVAASDLIRSLPDAPETSVPINKYMTKKVVCLDYEIKVWDVAKKMGRERIGSVIVKKDDKPWGIFTERDLLSKVIYYGADLQDPVGKYASAPLITIPPQYSIHKAALTMAEKHVRRLPVFKEEQLVGIITARDLVEAYAL
ncbi:MAG: CBS domain-containing protein [Candidatus Methanomethylicaceae archaeon]